MKEFAELKKNLKKDFTGFKQYKVAILGDSATQFLSQAVCAEGYDRNLDLQIWEADFNQIQRQVFDPTSGLYEYQPDIIIFFQSTHKLLNYYNKLTLEEYASLAENQLQLILNIYNEVTSKLSSKIIFFNFPEINDAVFGNYANKIELSFLFQLRKLNYELMRLASEKANLFIVDLSSIQNQIGISAMFHSSVYISTDMVLSLDALPEVAAKTLDTIQTLSGQFKKCLILDLDNTMWGGIIGDDGIENIQIGSLGIGKAFTEFQYWVKKLKNRGILLAVCSKNTESIAKEPFEKHPDMVLRLSDFAVFRANWENKVDNIRHIQSQLNIGFDSMVFLDDSPFERNIVRENIPQLTVPELPEDPAEYLGYLYSLNLFETTSFSNEDIERTEQYQIEAERITIQKSFTNEEDFLKTLKMVSVVEPFNKFNTPRVAQLSQRSNQFNLRTIRYTEAEIEKLSQASNTYTFAFTLEDKFGDNGLISAIILKKESADILFIDTWFMSCRVLKRGMENFTLNIIVNIAKKYGYNYLKGEYIPTLKNELIKNHYPDLGFEAKENYWYLNLSQYTERPCHISIHNLAALEK